MLLPSLNIELYTLIVETILLIIEVWIVKMEESSSLETTNRFVWISLRILSLSSCWMRISSPFSRMPLIVMRISGMQFIIFWMCSISITMKMISRIYSTSDAFMWFSHYKRCFCFFIIYYFFPFRVLIAVSRFQSVFLFLLWLEYAIHIWFVLLCWIPLFFPSLRSFLFMFLNNKSIYDPSCIRFISNGRSIIHVSIEKKFSLVFSIEFEE